jgi:hypothetical protein
MSGKDPYAKGDFRLNFYKEVMSDMYTDGFMMVYPHGTVVRQARRSFYYRGENQLYCFLQEKFPHFCKNFSPGTGGEILCQPQQL